ncbi:hypothetical protein ABZ297_33990 [Nonomuraea sp. NPDC005983]|uniref:hypothetical protein n=1 Tax=Nonomuraea sp. NPDC005983 TaxID=3155595 RepID=UPI0033A0894A
MKRILAGLALTTAAALVTAGPAQAAPAASADPVKALKKQFVAGQGVKLTETTKTTIGREQYAGDSKEGVVAFDANGVAGAEVTRTPNLSPEMRKRLEQLAEKNNDVGDTAQLLTERIYLVSTGNRLYANGGLFSSLLPESKLWVGWPGSPIAAANNDQIVNVFEPDTLKTLLATAKGRSKGGSGDQYRGSITIAQLYKVSPSFRKLIPVKPTGAPAKNAVSWRLSLDAQKLVKRIAISWSVKVTKKITLSVSTETRYSDWGSAVTVTAPPAEQVLDFKDLGKKGLKPPSTIDRDYVSVPPDDEGNTIP